MNPKVRVVLEILKAANGRFVSGEQIGNDLGVSRMSVLNYVQKLKDAGIKLESNTKSGYKLLPLEEDILNEETLALYTAVPAVVTDEVESTFKTAARTEPECVVVALRQSGGRGRRQRSFLSAEGGAYFNYVFEPNLEPSRVNLITLAAGIAVAQAANEIGVEVKLKFPNDGYVKDRKLCGILTECTMNCDTVSRASVGIGINVSNVLDPSLRDCAVRLCDIVKTRPVLRAKLIGDTVERLKTVMLCPEKIVETYRAYEYLADKTVTLTDDKGQRQGKYVGIDGEGYMLVNVGGEVQKVTIGEVSVRKV